MSKQQRSGWGGVLLNVVLAALGLVVLILLYALVSHTFFPGVDPVREANPAQLVGEIIQVEVRNGCGEPGIAGTTTKFLRRRGFDVVEVGDHASFDEAHSRVIDRVGDPVAARKVAAAMGIPEERVVEDVRRDLYLDATIILGRDYETLLPFRED